MPLGDHWETKHGRTLGTMGVCRTNEQMNEGIMLKVWTLRGASGALTTGNGVPMAPGQRFGVRGQGRVLGSGHNSIRFWAGARYQRRCGDGTVGGRADSRVGAHGELVTSLGAEPGPGLPASPQARRPGRRNGSRREQEASAVQRPGPRGPQGVPLEGVGSSRPPTTGLGGPGETLL